jgi:protein O-mannosyl-transferase
MNRSDEYERICTVKQWRLVAFMSAAMAITVAVYWNSLSNDFVNMDDLDLIVRNRHIKALTWETVKTIFTPGAVGAYQPVRTLSYAIDYHFWKLNPTGYHLTNIACHLLNVWLIFLIVRALRQPMFLAGVTALLFAVHPVHVEAVTWLSGRRDVLSGLFVLLALYAYIRCRAPSAATTRATRMLWYLLAVGACCLGLLSKAVAVITPALLVVYDGIFGVPAESRWRQRLGHIARSLGYYAPFAAAAAGFLAVFITTSRASGVARAGYHGDGRLTTFWTMLRVLAEYVYQLLAPTNLSVTYGIRTMPTPWHPAFLAAVLTLAGMAVLAIVAWKRAPIITFGVIWWALALLPVANIIPIAVVKADRYLYLPSIGVFVILAWACDQGWRKIGSIEYPGRKRLAQGLYVIIIAALLTPYAWLTIRRNADWLNSETLWNATLDTHPDSPIALNNLGLVYAERGDYERAINLYQYLLWKHPQQDRIERVYANLGNASADAGLLEVAFDAYQQALNVNPAYVEAYLGLARLNTGARDYAGAARIYEIALELEPNNERARVEFGKLRFIEGQYDAAIALFQAVLANNPYAIAAYNGLGLCYANTGRDDQAYQVYHQALALDPNSTLIRNSLGTLYMERGESAKAIVQFQELVRLDPENVEGRNNLGVLYLRAGQPADALRELMEAVRRQPDDAYIISNLAQAYAAAGLPEEAIEVARWALELNPTLTRTQVLLGDICAALDDVTCAVEAYEQALALQPDYLEAQERLRALRESRP